MQYNLNDPRHFVPQIIVAYLYGILKAVKQTDEKHHYILPTAKRVSLIC